MENTMERWYSVIKKRVSVRKYTGSATRDELRKLREIAKYMTTDDVRIVVGKTDGAFSPIIGRTISGTDTFAAVLSKSKDDEYMIGMVGEAFVLECTAMGLGTCWTGKSYSKSAVYSSIKSDEQEKLCCVIAIGHYDNAPAKKKNRKDIFSLTGLNENAFKKLPEWQQSAISCGQIAPSALNAQPWEFDILNSNSIQIANISKNFGYGKIDCGIAMLHIEVGAAHCGIYGDWQISDGLPVFTADYSMEA